MNREIEQAILTEGYRFCRVQPENIGVFYKYYQQGFHVVMMISLEDTQALTVEQHQVMQERVMDLFIIRREDLQIFRKAIRFIMWNCLHCCLVIIRI